VLVIHNVEVYISFFQHVLATLHEHVKMFVFFAAHLTLLVLFIGYLTLEIELYLEVCNAGLMSHDVVGQDAVG